MDDEAFLEAIRASPQDDRVRLVYADWLEEHGDADRAEFIRTQIALDRLPWWDARVFCAHLRWQQIIERDPERWDDDLPAWARKVHDTARYQSYRRGMPSILRCDLSDWLSHGQELLERYPIESIDFGWQEFRDRLCDWLYSPLTGRVKQYNLNGLQLADDHVKTMAASPAPCTSRRSTCRTTGSVMRGPSPWPNRPS